MGFPRIARLSDRRDIFLYLLITSFLVFYLSSPSRTEFPHELNYISDPMELMHWEDKVIPPPPGEWLKHMPEGYIPEELPPYVFRIAYLIPSNRTAQLNAVYRLQYLMNLYRDFYMEQMDRHGLGQKSFKYETEIDGMTPKINIINAPNDDSYYRTSPWTRVVQAIQNAGFPVWSDGQVWMITYEAHVMNPDGSITGGYNGGATLGTGKGSDGGVGMTAGCTLALINNSYILDNRIYDGVTIPELGSYSMVYGSTAAWFDGDSVSSLSSVDHGIFMHEVSHGLYLWHDFRNDLNFDGNMEGNGFRGARGYLYPQFYPENEFRLTYGSALALNNSRYFNSDSTFTDNTLPAASITSLNMDSTTGHLGIQFSASDSGGLALALFRTDGNTIGEMILKGPSTDTVFYTPYYIPGQSNSIAVTVYDSQNNVYSANSSITPSSSMNNAPKPFIRIKPSICQAGESMEFSAPFSSDPNGDYPMMIEWDLNGDGLFDTPTTNYSYTLSTAFNQPGTRLIRARLTDSTGLKSVSAPIAIRILEPEVTYVKEDWTLYH